jgi:hypothetical protein
MGTAVKLDTSAFSPVVAAIIEHQESIGRAVVLDNIRKTREWKVQIRCYLVGSWYLRSVAQDKDLLTALVTAVARSDTRTNTE